MSHEEYVEFSEIRDTATRLDYILHERGWLADEQHLQIDVQQNRDERIYTLIIVPGGDNLRYCLPMSYELSAKGMRAVLYGMTRVINLALAH